MAAAEKTSKICIVGGGMAGITCAKTLTEAGFTEVFVFEAQGKIGGRISTHYDSDSPDDPYKFEYGANWIHGLSGNPIFKVAKENKLICKIPCKMKPSGRSKGITLEENGKEVKRALAKFVHGTYWSLNEEADTFFPNGIGRGYNSKSSVEDFIRQESRKIFQNNHKDKKEGEEKDNGFIHEESDLELKMDLITSYLKYETYISGCHSMSQVSLEQFGSYECMGGGEPIIGQGYVKVVEALARSIPAQHIYLNSPVSQIAWKKKDCNRLLSGSLLCCTTTNDVTDDRLGYNSSMETTPTSCCHRKINTKCENNKIYEKLSEKEVSSDDSRASSQDLTYTVDGHQHTSSTIQCSLNIAITNGQDHIETSNQNPNERIQNLQQNNYSRTTENHSYNSINSQCRIEVNGQIATENQQHICDTENSTSQYGNNIPTIQTSHSPTVVNTELNSQTHNGIQQDLSNNRNDDFQKDSSASHCRDEPSRNGGFSNEVFNSSLNETNGNVSADSNSQSTIDTNGSSPSKINSIHIPRSHGSNGTTNYSHSKASEQNGYTEVNASNIPSEFHSRIPTKSCEHCDQLLVQGNSETTELENGKEKDITLTLKDGSKHFFDHVIFTCSLGHLKHYHDTLFQPNLPKHKRSAITRLGIGTVDKIFLEFEDLSFLPGNLVRIMLCWREGEKATADVPKWTRKISCVDVVNKPRDNLLLTWITGLEAEEMETLSEEEVGRGIVQLLKCFLNNPDIPPPKRVIRTQWGSNEFTHGSYSYVAVGATAADISTLAEPIYTHRDKPVMQFAGEATHEKYYSTVHGAYLSGEREANRLIQYYSTQE